MSKSFTEDLRLSLAEKKHTQAEQARARRDEQMKRREEREEYIEKGFQLMLTAWRAASEALTGEGFKVQLRPHDVSINGKPLQAGHVVTIFSPTTPLVTVKIDLSSDLVEIRRGDESRQSQGIRVASSEEAQKLVRAILEDVELI